MLVNQNKPILSNPIDETLRSTFGLTTYYNITNRFSFSVYMYFYLSVVVGLYVAFYKITN